MTEIQTEKYGPIFFQEMTPISIC